MKTSSLSRTALQQCRWSKGLIPTSHNPTRLKYCQSEVADMSWGQAVDDLQKGQVMARRGSRQMNSQTESKSNTCSHAPASQKSKIIIIKRFWKRHWLDHILYIRSIQQPLEKYAWAIWHNNIKNAPVVIHTSIDASRSLLLKLLKCLSGSISADSRMFNMISQLSANNNLQNKTKLVV